jgi:tetratricopeptide (TPR) repeat protein
LVKRNDRSDLYGVSEIKNGNWQKGVELLEEAIDRDSNNVWLYMHLAKAKLALNELEGYHFYKDVGQKIHPYYEPFYLLEANHLFDQGKYAEAMDQIDTLLQINPRYLPANALYDELKKIIN